MDNFSPTQAVAAMSRELGALQQGNRLVLMAHGRWHYLTLSPEQGRIMSVNFISAEMAMSAVKSILPEAMLIRFADISPIFLTELAKKVLPDAKAYRPLLENGRCRLIIGHTTDTLRELEADIGTLIETIQQRMNGKRGAYLSFH